MENVTKTLDPTRVTPATHKAVFENDRVRVVDINVKPGAKVPMHSHPQLIAVGLGENCEIKFASPDGKEQRVEFKSGDMAWREAESHSAENIGSTECHALNIEFK